MIRNYTRMWRPTFSIRTPLVFTQMVWSIKGWQQALYTKCNTNIRSQGWTNSPKN